MGLGSCVNAATLLVLLRRRGIYSPLSGWGRYLLRVLAGSAVMGAALWFGQRGLDWSAMTWTVRAAGVLGMVAAAALLYFAVISLFGWRLSDIRPKD